MFLLMLLNELRKRDKIQGLPSILSLFRNEYNKFNNTRALMLDSIYQHAHSYFSLGYPQVFPFGGTCSFLRVHIF